MANLSQKHDYRNQPDPDQLTNGGVSEFSLVPLRGGAKCLCAIYDITGMPHRIRINNNIRQAE